MSDYKTGEWIMTIAYHEKIRWHDGDCSDAGSIDTTEEDYDLEIKQIPYYVKPEHVKDFVVVDEYIITRLCNQYNLLNYKLGSGYCRYRNKIENEDDCGYHFSDIHIEIRPIKCS